ncbi:MAG: RNA 2',3'-cyclic phosphodiesterase [Dehalococcoidia bacterium]|nr:RNA 2',3'-cyclic phosphodiesterase [Dehalococcoidia bacterium]
MRLFVAIEPPEAWRDAATRIGDALRRAAGDAPLRLVDPALTHLTVRFLGEVDEAHADALRVALGRHAPPVAVPLELAPAGTFGAASRTQVAWLGVGGDLQALQALASRVEAAVVEAGLPREERPSRPHLTLARAGNRATADQRRAIAEAARALDAPPTLPFEAREVSLVRSFLGGAQPRYEVLQRWR